MDSGFSKTTLKESYILNDPHADKGRAPMMATRDTQVNVGKYTIQRFSGAVSMAQKAEMLKRIDSLYKAVITALENANNVEVQKSELGSKVFEYLHA
jgi:regulator of protease activity HflC (stomatin/prohibitin superfamily)